MSWKSIFVIPVMLVKPMMSSSVRYIAVLQQSLFGLTNLSALISQTFHGASGKGKNLYINRLCRNKSVQLP